MRQLTGDVHLAEALEGYGITHVFMVPTVGVSALAAMDERGIEGITTHAEKAAAYMADGFARVRRGPGVCMAQSIGRSNLAAGLRDAFMAGSPVVALTGGHHPRSRYRNTYQEIEDGAMFDAVTKSNVRCDDVRRFPDLLRQAFRDATSGAPGPVHLEIQGLAANLLGRTLEWRDNEPVWEATFAGCPALRTTADGDALRDALDRLAAAARPVIVAGGGVRWSGAQQELLAVARAMGIPVATSLNAKGVVDERDPLAVGVVGSYSRGSANRVVEAADAVFFVGSGAGSQVTDNWRLPATGTLVIQLDIDACELGRNYPNAVSLFGDAKASLTALLRLAGDAVVPADRSAWLRTAAGWVQEWRTENASRLTSDDIPIRPERLCAELNGLLPADAIIVVDTGHAGIWSGSMMDVAPEQSYIRCAGSLGWAFPAALGASCAAPDRKVVCFTGDGGFYYHLAELETARRHDIDVVVVVNDNASLGQDKAIFERAWNGRPSEVADRMWRFSPVDLAAVAEQFGCTGIRVERPADLDKALRTALSLRGPVVVDVVTDPAVVPDPPYGGVDFYSA